MWTGAAAVASSASCWRDFDLLPISICMLGEFRLLKAGRAVSLRSGGKSEALLADLALRRGHAVPREELFATLWPDSEAALAAQSLNSLVYSLHKLLGDAIGGAAPIVSDAGRYRLNIEAGIGVDVVSFDELVAAGERDERAGRRGDATDSYTRAAALYRGDLSGGADISAIVERERLRARYLTVLSRLADHRFRERDYEACLDYALRLLASDPCREDAHRLVMRCHVRRGERAQALRQFRLCEQILRREFDATPEPSTVALFRQIRLDPASV